ncbi:RICIN domain-containing protein [Actinocorallia aurea]
MASAEAKKSRKPVEVVQRTSQTRRLTALPSGEFKFEQSASPERVKRGGKWRDVDLTLVKRGGRIQPKETAAPVTLSAGGADPFIEMSKGGKSLSLTPNVETLPAPVLDGDTARYPDALGPGLDLVAKATPVGVSHYIIVKTPEAAQSPSLDRIDFDVAAAGLEVARQKGDTLTVSDGGTAWAAAPRPRMWEAPKSGETDLDTLTAGAIGEAAEAPLKVEADAAQVSLLPDQALLSNEDVNYPLVIAPVWQTWSGDAEGVDPDIVEPDNTNNYAASTNAEAPNTTYPVEYDCAYAVGTIVLSCAPQMPINVGYQSATQKWLGYVRLDASPIWTWTNESEMGRNLDIKINSALVSFGISSYAACNERTLRLFAVQNRAKAGGWTWNAGPATGWQTHRLLDSAVAKGWTGTTTSCTKDSSQRLEFSSAAMAAWFQTAVNQESDFVTVGVFPSATYYDDTSHTYVVGDSAGNASLKRLGADPRIVVTYSRDPYAPAGLEVGDTGTAGGDWNKRTVCEGSKVGIATGFRRFRALISDTDSDNSNPQQNQLLRGRWQIDRGQEVIVRNDEPDQLDDAFQPANFQNGSDTIYRAEVIHDVGISRMPDLKVNGPDGGTPYTARVWGEDDTYLWSVESQCTFTVDEVRPNAPAVWSRDYPQNRFGGYDPATRAYRWGWFGFGPNNSGDVTTFRYQFNDETVKTVTVPKGTSSGVSWQPKKAGVQWLDVWSIDEAGNVSDKTRFEFGLEQPPRDAAWSMDEKEGATAVAVSGTGNARPDANLILHNADRNADGNIAGVMDDRSVSFRGVVGSYGEVPARGPDGQQIPLVDTSKPFMVSTWVKPRSTATDQAAVGFGSQNGSRFELGLFGGKWSFRHIRVDGSVAAQAVRDQAKPSNGTEWTANWVSLMAGFDPATDSIWLRTQSPDNFGTKCIVGWKAHPDNEQCDVYPVLDPQDPIKPVTDNEPLSPGSGGFVLGAATGKDGGNWANWNGWIDDTQVWPLSRTQKATLNAIYGETVQPLPLKGGSLGSSPDGMIFRLENINAVDGPNGPQCLDNIDSRLTGGAELGQYGCFTDQAASAWPSQDFKVTEVGFNEYSLTSMNSLKSGQPQCVTINGDRVPAQDVDRKNRDGSDRTPDEAAANVNLWPCEDGAPDQTWVIAPVDGGYQLVSRAPDADGNALCLESKNGAKADGSDVVSASCTGPTDADEDAPRAAQQVWKLRSSNSDVARFADGVERRLVNVNSGLCLNVPGASVNGLKLKQYVCNSSTAQDWRLTQTATDMFTLTNPAAGRCVDAPYDGEVRINEGMHIWDCNGRDAQQFRAVKQPGGYWLINRKNKLCLSVQDNSLYSDIGVLETECGGTAKASQLWDISQGKDTYLDAQTVRIRSVDTANDRCIDIPWGSTAENEQVQQAGCNTSGAQDWTLASVGDGSYTLRNSVSEKCLEVADGSTAAGARIQQRSCDYTQRQMFYVGQVANHEQRFSGYQLVSRVSGMALQPTGGAPGDGVKITQAAIAQPAAQAQTWKLELASEAPAPPPAAPQPSFAEDFTGADGMITNEYGHWNPEDPAKVTSPVWETTSGTLMRRGNVGWTGVPDGIEPNATSANGTGSNSFRMRSRRDDFTDFRVDLRLRNLGFSGGTQSYDGAHLMLRQRGDDEYYYVTFRRDGAISVKKVLDGDSTHRWVGGANDIPLGVDWTNVSITVAGTGTQVVIKVIVNGAEVLSVTDTPDATLGGRTIAAAGSVGVGGDFAQLEFDDIKVFPL